MAAVHQPQQGLHCNNMVVGAVASITEDVPLVTQATAALSRVNLHQNEYPPKTMLLF